MINMFNDEISVSDLQINFLFINSNDKYTSQNDTK